MVTGWQLDEYTSGGKLVKQWSYYDPVNGDLKTSCQNVDGKWYYLYSDGLRGGMHNINGKQYYFDPVTYEMKTGWMLLEDPNPSWYYFDPVSGALPEGWKNIDGKWYYFKYSAVKGSREIDGKFYYFDPVNCDMKTGWLVLNGSRYYADLNDGGAFASNKTLIIDGVSYTFDIGGSVINNEP